MSYIITGGAGFIGSCLIRMLNDLGITDIYVVDDIHESIKWRNLIGKQYIEYFNKDNFINNIITSLKGITHVVHLGACSSTTEQNFDYLVQNNIEYSKRLYSYCKKNEIEFIYASSAATYGTGNAGFSDRCNLNSLRPINRYGFSKHRFDIWVARQSSKPPKCIGLKFFNVYGPNEYHKGKMASMAYQGYCQIQRSGHIGLFRSYNKDYLDGMQQRDFVYVMDVCRVIIYFIKAKLQYGLFNVGSGKAYTYNDLATAIFRALNLTPKIQYIDMPSEIINSFQYHTCADLSELREAGYGDAFVSLEKGVEEYISQYLLSGDYF